MPDTIGLINVWLDGYKRLFIDPLKIEREEFMTKKILCPSTFLLPLILLVQSCGSTSSQATLVPIKLSETVGAKTITFAPSASRTVENSPTHTPEPSTSVTFRPTLSDSQAQESIINLLKDNGNCELPCWWGIRPGNSLWTATNNELKGLGLKVLGDDISGTYMARFSFSGEEHATFLWIDFSVENNVVKIMNIKAQGNGNLVSFNKVFANLAPERIMNDFGPPTQVNVNAGIGGGGQTPLAVFYTISFFYGNNGFSISYGGKAIYSPVSRFCPTLRTEGNLNGEISLVLQSKNIPLQNSSLGYQLQDAARITTRDLYNLYTQNQKPVCFDTSTDLWK
jgi:hypothetical protein